MRLSADLSFSEQVSAATQSAFVQALVERGESAWTADPNVPNWSTIRGGSKVVLLGVNRTIVPYRPMLGTVASCPARSFFIQVAQVTWSEPLALGWTRPLRLHHPFTWLECSSWATHDSPFPRPGRQAVATLASTFGRYHMSCLGFFLGQWKFAILPTLPTEMILKHEVLIDVYSFFFLCINNQNETWNKLQTNFFFLY